MRRGAGLFSSRHSRGRGLGRRWRQQLPGAKELRAAGRTEDAVIADFRGALGQDVLKKPVNELGCGKLDVTNLLSLVVAITETHNAVVERFQTAVGNGDAENVAAKIIEHLVASASMFGMNDPANLPDGGGNESKKPCLFQTGTELGAEDHRQSGVGNQKARMLGIDPGLAIGSEASCGDEHVNVRMEKHGAGPGVKNGQSADASAQQ